MKGHGLGHDGAALGALSLRVASAEAAGRVALVTDEREWTFAELGAAARGLSDAPTVDGPRRVVLWGRRTVSSLLRLDALLDRGDVITLLHPDWSTQAARRAAARVRASFEFDGERVRPVTTASSAVPDSPPDGSRLGADVDWVRGVVLFTSGTTGRPKGVVLSHRALLAAAQASARRLGWQPDDRWLLRLPIAHVGGLSIVTRCLAARSTVVLDSSPTFEPEDFVERLTRTRTTLVSLVPTMLHRLVEAGLAAPQSVRLALIGGAASRVELLERAAQLGWPTATTYGMTEACSQIATAAQEEWGRAVDHVGRELDGLEVRLVADGSTSDSAADPEVITDAGEAGRLQIRGPSLFDGYLGEARRDPEAWFSTGDWAKRGEDGNLRILARRSDLIVSGGENVAPARVEEVLAGHPAIEDACVVGIEDPEWGQRVAALLVQRAGRPRPSDASLASFLRSRLTRYEVPRRIVWVEELPTKASGKLDRRAARRFLEDQPAGEPP